MKITSRKNDTVALYRSLLRSSSARRENGMFVVEGNKLCNEAINSGLEPLGALFSEKAMNKYPELCKKISEKVKTDEISGELCEYISDTKTPQGLFTSFGVLDKKINFDKIYNYEKIIILDRLQDPGNIGTIIRTADAFGINAIIASEDTVDLHSPKVLRSAAGSIFRVPFYQTALGELLPTLKKKDFSIYAAVLDESSEKLSEISFPEKTAVVIGNEGNGVSPELSSLANGLYIPIIGAESLNAAVAAALIIYEMCKKTIS